MNIRTAPGRIAGEYLGLLFASVETRNRYAAYIKTLSMPSRIVRAPMIPASSEPIAGIAKGIISRRYEQKGLRLLGSGLTSTVVQRNPDEVMKINRPSEYMSERERQAYLNKLIDNQGKALQHLSVYVLRQTIAIESHPLYPKKDVIIATQQFVPNFEPLDPKRPQTFTGNLRPEEQVRDFIKRADTMMSVENVVPDLGGDSNLGFEGENLILLDTFPIEADEIWAQESISAITSIKQALQI